MPTPLSLDSFLSNAGLALDVRSPSEFKHGHIPGTISLPLMDDEDRHIIGTAYKQQGQEYAIELGFERIAPKLLPLFKQGKGLLTKKGELMKILCWRGGMRSGFVARLFESFGFKTATLQGGYKTFRRWVSSTFDALDSAPEPLFHVLGGMTGSGKTTALQALKDKGEQVIDLEGLACHRGSSFGMLGQPPQPSTEQFHNEIACLLRSFDFSRPIWIEDESRLIGSCHLPDTLYRKILSSTLFLLERTIDERLDNLMNDYGSAPKEQLIEATKRIAKRLGKQKADDVVLLIQGGNRREAARLILTYYDQAYQHGLTMHQQQQRRPQTIFEM
jgi:tRNA 2-selenouridine synthase